jgi:hypothetical protein
MDGKNQRKVFAVAVQTSTSNIKNSKTLTSPKEKPDVIVMPAQESVHDAPPR